MKKHTEKPDNGVITDPDHHVNDLDLSLSHDPSIYKISLKSVHNILRSAANGQTKKQTHKQTQVRT